MIRRFHALASIAVVLALGACAAPESQSPAASRRHVVAFVDEGSVPAGFDARVASLGGTVEATYPAMGVVTVSGLSPDAVDALRSDPAVEAVTPDARIQLSPGDSAARVLADPATVEAEPGAPTAPIASPVFARQWHLQVIGADRAREAGHRGEAGVTVAVLDTGVDYTHPDLEGRVDLARSRSFVPADDAVVAERFPGRHPVTDLHFHGTHVASTVTSNARRVAGVASNVTVIGVKVLDQRGDGSFTDIVAGLQYAADAGADVINLSLGGLLDPRADRNLVGVVRRAVAYAHSRGAVVVVAAGNDHADLDSANAQNALCRGSGAICVGATGPAVADGPDGPFHGVDTIAPYSNYGSDIDLVAPGGDVEPVWGACSTTSLALAACRTPGRAPVVGLVGTSMAAPHVAGLAALLVPARRRDPDAIAAAIRASSDDLGVAGRDPFFGHGRINVARALGM